MSVTLLDNRYELKEKLGEGGMAIVYRALDLHTEKEVALKVLKTNLGGTARKRFAREFRTLRLVDHPYCIRVLDFGDSHETPYFTMELFAGAPITRLHGKPLGVILHALYQVASAIEHIHAKDILHRDIKPSNLLVRLLEPKTADSSAVDVRLTDFGLARFHNAPSSLTLDSTFVGTFQYCAPEQISGYVIDHRADLYSFGMVCYELLTGHYPFDKARHAGLQNLMRAQLCENPSPLCHFLPHFSRELEAVILQMLAKQPADRPASITVFKHLLATHLHEAVDPSEPSTSDGPTPLMKPGFIARELEVGAARRLLRQALSPHFLSHSEWVKSPIPSVVFIRGDAGIGKSRLLDEIKWLAQGQGTNVYVGRCFKGNLAPYQPFVDILRHLLLEIRSEARKPSVAESDDVPLARESGGPLGTVSFQAKANAVELSPLSALVDDFSPELLRIAPDLRRWVKGEAFKQVELHRETKYVLRAVANFFIEISMFRSICLCIEDLQWADQGSLDLLRHMSSALFRSRELSVESNLTSPSVLICCTVRTGLDHVHDMIKELGQDKQGCVLELQPFSRLEVRTLVSLVLNCAEEAITETLVDRLHRVCQGNAFFVCESLRAWQEAGRLFWAHNKWDLDTSSHAEEVLPDSVREVLSARLQALSAQARQILMGASVVGNVVSIDFLMQLCTDVSENDFLASLDELLAAKIMVETHSGLHLEFTHDLIRELAYEDLSASRRRALHRRVGEVLEERGSAGLANSPEVLARHFCAARVDAKAFRYLLEAGAAALASYAADDAITHLNTARDLLSEIQEPQAQFRLFDLLAAAQSAAGHPREAIEDYKLALAIAPDALVRARLLEKIGHVCFRIGDFDLAVEFFDRSLAEVRMRRPKSGIAVISSVVTSFVRNLWPTWLSFRRAPNEEQRARLVIAHDIYDRLGYLWVQRSVTRCAQAMQFQMTLARRIGAPAYLANAYSKLALMYGGFAFNRTAMRAARQALAFASACGNAEFEAIAKGHIGSGDYFGSRFVQAEQLLREALAVLDRRGDSWIRMLFYHNLRHMYGIQADTKQEIDCANIEMEIGEAVHDPEGSCWGAYGLANALARSGRVDEAKQYIRQAMEIISGRINIIVLPTALHTDGFVHLQSGDYAAARQVLEGSVASIQKNWAFVDYTVRAYPLLTESLLGPRWWKADADGIKVDDLRRAWRISRAAMFWGRRFRNYLPHALRARGRAAFAWGKHAKALDCFLQAITAAEAIGARYDLARACIDLAKISSHQSDEYHERGLQILQLLGAAVPPDEL